MKEKFKEFVAAKRAVSPVIGVVLMVAVVVILAAVIGAFVLGLGGNQTTAPQASFNYDAATDTLTMSGGDAIQSGQLSVEGQAWAFADGNGDNTVTAGETMTVAGGDITGGAIQVVWTSADGTESATLTTIEVSGDAAPAGG